VKIITIALVPAEKKDQEFLYNLRRDTMKGYIEQKGDAGMKNGREIVQCLESLSIQKDISSLGTIQVRKSAVLESPLQGERCIYIIAWFRQNFKGKGFLRI